MINMTMEVPVSIAENMGLPIPAVDTLEPKRVVDVVLFMASAVPPPAIIAKAQVITGLKSATVKTIKAVPAMVAKGTAIVSNALSATGI